MTPSELKHLYELSNEDGHFFDRKTMRFFGDTMRNFGCALISKKDGKELYQLYRKRPVKNGLQSEHFFIVDTKNGCECKQTTKQGARTLCY